MLLVLQPQVLRLSSAPVSCILVSMGRALASLKFCLEYMSIQHSSTNRWSTKVSIMGHDLHERSVLIGSEPEIAALWIPIICAAVVMFADWDDVTVVLSTVTSHLQVMKGTYQCNHVCTAEQVARS